MAGFVNSGPKTQARNLALKGAILLQFQKFHILVNDPQFLSLGSKKKNEKEAAGVKIHAQVLRQNIKNPP